MGLYPRRMWQRQLVAGRMQQEEGIVALCRAQKAATPGTDLPDDFPARAALLAADYTALEDLGTPPCDEWTRDRLREELVTAGLCDSDAALVAAHTWTIP